MGYSRSARAYQGRDAASLGLSLRCCERHSRRICTIGSQSAKVHSVAQSATSAQAATSRRITRSAMCLADRYGLDGFTMDDLAEAAEVSRRTLFNYFPSKIDAVLGDWVTLDPSAVSIFCAGGPRGDLVLDLRDLVTPLLDTNDVDRETITLSRRILVANPRLLSAVHHRHEAMSAEVVGHIVTREGNTFSKTRAKVAVALLAAIFHSAIENYLDDRHARSLVHHLDDTFTTARSLLA